MEIIRQCKGCWRVVETRYTCEKCTGFSRTGSIKPYVLLKWEEFMASVRPMFWSVFSHCNIEWDATPSWCTFIKEETDGFGSKIHEFDVAFDAIIPEYRLAVDFVDDLQALPVDEEQDTFAQIDRVRVDDAKQKCCVLNNFRHVSLPMDVDKARNKLLEIINEIYVLDRDGKPQQILSPKLQGDAGWDLVCDEDVVCLPGVGTDIPSQVFLEIPNHLYAVVQARSSTSKKRLLVLPGVIDPAYRGQIFTMTFNPTTEPVLIKKGDRISQLLFFPRIPHLHVNPVSSLRPSERGIRGFGSTG